MKNSANKGLMLTEYADCGTVYDFLHDKGMPENLDIAHKDRYAPYWYKLSWMLQCAKAVAFLHGMTPKIFHNDLRTRHLLLSNNFETLKICDFSTATESDPSNTTRSYYLNLFAEKSDIFNFGIIIWEGVAYLHGLNPKIIHRDLKSQNLLLLNNYRTLKICDFGTLRPLATMMTVVGTAAYMAPEVYAHTQVDLGSEYTEKCDVYSFAIVCWEIMSQKKPFYHNEIRCLSRIKHENIVQFYCAMKNSANKGLMITEYADCGTVYDFLHYKGISPYQEVAFTHNISRIFHWTMGNKDRYAPYSYKLSWMLQCAKAVAFLHGMTPKIFHNDLRTRHLLLSNNFETLKICDFSTATESDPSNTTRSYYLNLFAEKTEIYNFGIVIWETFIAKLYNPRVLDAEISEIINGIISLCCDNYPINRPKMSELVILLDSLYRQVSKIEQSVVYWFDLRLIKPAIGCGAFGEVFKAVWTTKDRTRNIAVKRIRDIDPEVKVEKEVKYWSLVNHENIVKLYGTTKDNEHQTIVVMEYAECGSLYNFLHGERRENTERKVSILGKLNWMLQCAKGVAYLHDLNPKIIHRDLKSHNLLLFNHFCTLKICDFGTVRPLASSMTVAGTAAYMAPEVGLGSVYTEKCDVYSFGIVCWEIMSQKKPFYHVEIQDNLVIMNLACKNDRPPIVDVEINDQTKFIREWIQQCWDLDPKKRPTMQDMVVRLGIDPLTYDGSVKKTLPVISEQDFS
ncbi:hypothetical protein ACLKA7_003984 [Drosophila subpalustris]